MTRSCPSFATALVCVIALVGAAATGGAAAAGVPHFASAPAAGSFCYYSQWGDPKGDAQQLDAIGYAAEYDCPSGQWTFPIVTNDAWASSQLLAASVAIDTDGNPNTGCGGFEYLVRAVYSAATAQLTASTLNTPTCGSTTWSLAGPAQVQRNDNTSISLRVATTTLHTADTLRWFASIQGTAEATADFMPDTGYHLEEGFSGGSCPDTLFAGPAAHSYGTVGDAGRAVSLLHAAGFADAHQQGSGVVTVAGDPAAAERVLTAAGLAAHLSPDRTFSFDRVPNDPGFASQWNLNAINVTQAWDQTQGSAGVVVADIDSGVDATHPDLAGKLIAGFDATTGLALAAGDSDTVGHGTATAGLIGAATNNAQGLAGVGWNTSVMPIKTDTGGEPLASAIVAGVRYAADHGARIINLSLGSDCSDPNMADAVTYAQSKGLLVVASAGNNLQMGNRLSYPAVYPGVVAVGATGFDGLSAAYSSQGSYLDIVAPGGSADGNPAHDLPLLAPGGGIAREAGTSFSAPEVAAAAALVIGARPDIGAGDVASDLFSTATHLGDPGRNAIYGWGMLNVGAAVAKALTPGAFQGTPPPVAPPAPVGYWMVGSGGDVYAFGASAYLGGSPGGAVKIEPTVTGKGYWILKPGGSVASFGDATFLGNAGPRLAAGENAVSLSATPSGAGYWVFTDRGRVLTFGDARTFGDMAGIRLNGPVLGSTATPTGKGYYMVASDGGIFTFGDAVFRGSMGGQHLNAPVTGLVPSASGGGYWLVASDGGIFAFQAPFRGSMGATRLNRPIAGMVRFGDGYLMVGQDGGIFDFSDQQFLGSLGSNPPALPIVSVAALG